MVKTREEPEMGIVHSLIDEWSRTERSFGELTLRTTNGQVQRAIEDYGGEYSVMHSRRYVLFSSSTPKAYPEHG
jgi:hypothetical protein